ncbi:MAG: hypothetical protein JO220_07860 [Hyphomicrobiales bacterium]|nr:hypothetical protein [Hyphomicrobiales bacterium]
MRNLLPLAFAFLLASLSPVLAQNFKPVDDPEKFAADVVQTLANGDIDEAAKTVIDTVGQPGALSSMQTALQIFKDKKFDFSKKVIDEDLNGALRKIIYYAYVDKLGFVYFRFNFKMSSKGWVLAHFLFKTETNELLPKDF